MLALNTIHTVVVLHLLASLSLYCTEGSPQNKIKYYRKHPMSHVPSSRPWRTYSNRYYGKRHLARPRTPFYNDVLPESNLRENALRKLTVYKKPVQSAPKFKPPPKELFQNFVTPKETVGYEVTTEKFQDSEPETPSAPLPLGADHDLAIAIDDGGEEPRGLYSERPQHRNPLVYLDSYGRPLAGKTASHGHSRGRVRMQVFRGPTRQLGHGHKKKKWAQWGYYVVQPAAHHPHHPY